MPADTPGADTRTGWPSEGRLREPFPGKGQCQNVNCEVPLTYEATAAYLHSNRETGKVIVFCGACSQDIQMNHSLRFPLVAL